MAKFRESLAQDPGVLPPAVETLSPVSGEGRTIGQIISETRNLTPEQVERILAHQREKGVRFGDAAVALGFASADDVLFALAQQFNYPYASEERRKSNPELVALNLPFSAQAESFRALRSQIILRLFNETQERRAIAVVSPDAGDGKTFFVANLAVTLAQLGGRTLVVDADLRGSRQHEVFGVDNSAGLSGILSGRSELRVIQQVTGVPNLFVLPVGVTPPNPLELVERPAFGLLIRELLSKFDNVVVDTPAAIYGSDYAVVAARCGAALVIARGNQSRVAELRELVGTLSESPAKVMGVVLNDH